MVVPRTATWAVRAVGMAASLGVLGIAAAMLAAFQSNDGGYQMVTTHVFASPLGISWTLGVDGISLFLVLMSALLFPITLAGATERRNPKAFTVWVLILEAGCLGSFLSLDVMLFFLFFEATLVPVYFIIGGWGHERRGYAATKFFLYTFLASAVMLVGILALVFIHQGQTGVTTFDIRQLASTHLSRHGRGAPVPRLHDRLRREGSGLPLPHLVAGRLQRGTGRRRRSSSRAIMAKLGTYGIVRFDLGLFPHAVVVLAPLLLTLGVIGILYGGIVAAVQRDLKRLVAYSSLAHMGFIVLGAFALTGEALSGAVLQMVNHGLYTAALFLLIAMIYRRRQTFMIPRLRGLQRTAPVMAGVFTLVMLASIGVPGLNGFVGEFLILAGTFLTHRWWAWPRSAGSSSPRSICSGPTSRSSTGVPRSWRARSSPSGR